MTVHLQGIGNVPAITADKLEAGMTRIFNYGYENVIASVVPLNDRWSDVTYILSDGKLLTKRVRHTTKVAVRKVS